VRELASNPGVAFSRTKLLQKVWGMDYCGDERTVDVHIRRLRAAIEEPWKLHGTFYTVRGYGYKFVRP
jgi:DNA-binding response OmpR family regulator